MAKGSGRPPIRQDLWASGATTLATWLADNRDVLDGLLGLRELGAKGAAALEIVVSVRAVQTIRLAWELWEEVVLAGGGDPERLLFDHVPLDLIGLGRAAIWGGTTPGGTA
ncbi:MAG: hypothetical protein LC808_15825 [Actinobacteria bacterium]|nr:hypothetical protein [Actinomycetota bacterium]